MTTMLEWLNDYTANRLAAEPNELGVEIEVEGQNLPPVISANWRIDRDGSLRGESAEFVTVPIKFSQLDSVMDELSASYRSYNSTIDESVRAGVHVHLNVQRLTIQQFFTMVTGYFLLEDLLVRWCGPAREGNHFCLRSKEGEYVLFQLAKAAQDRKLRPLDTDTIRYCSMNLFSLFKYGTVEFRAMRGTGNLKDIKTWARMLHSILVNSQRYEDPVDLILSMSGDGEDVVLRNLLPDYHSLVATPDMRESIRESGRRLQLMAHSTDWKNFVPRTVKKEERDANNLEDQFVEAVRMAGRARPLPGRRLQPAAPPQPVGQVQPNAEAFRAFWNVDNLEARNPNPVPIDPAPELDDFEPFPVEDDDD